MALCRKTPIIDHERHGMAVDPIVLGLTGGLDGDEPGCDRLVALFGPRAPLVPGRKAERLQEGVCGRIYRINLQFTPTDRATLAAWARETSHGYDRLNVEQGSLEDGTWATYALVYVLGQAWSTWGVTRRSDHLEVWRCSSGKTVSRHARMANALTSLPHAADHLRALPVLERAWADWNQENACESGGGCDSQFSGLI